MEEAPRYSTLRDYLRVLRASWVLVVALTLLGGVVAYVVSKRQATVYEASASISFQDPSQQLDQLSGATPLPTPQQQTLVSSTAAIDSPRVAARVQRLIGGATTAQALQSAVALSVDPSSGLVRITGRSGDAAAAAAIANGFAKEGTFVANEAARAKFAAAARRDEQRIRRLGSGPAAHAEAVLLADQLTKLHFLSTSADPARVVAAATPPSGPSSPHTRRNTAIGLVVGLALGVLLAFGRDALDRRLRDSRDVERLLGLPVVGRVRAEALGGMVRGGPDLESFRILRQNLRQLGRDGPPRSILVTSPADGEGKSTVAASLAFALALSGRRTALVDADLRRGVLAQRLGLEATPGLSEYLREQADLRDAARSVAVDGAAEGSLALIPAGAPTDRAAELFDSRRAHELMVELASDHDEVVVDAGPLLALADALALVPEVEAVLLCVRLEQTTREGAAAAAETLGRLGERPAGVVVTGVQVREPAYAGSA